LKGTRVSGMGMIKKLMTHTIQRTMEILNYVNNLKKALYNPSISSSIITRITDYGPSGLKSPEVDRRLGPEGRGRG